MFQKVLDLLYSYYLTWVNIFFFVAALPQILKIKVIIMGNKILHWTSTPLVSPLRLSVFFRLLTCYSRLWVSAAFFLIFSYFFSFLFDLLLLTISTSRFPARITAVDSS